MYTIQICNSLHLSGKPVNPVIYSQKEKLDDALYLALGLHQNCTEKHFVLVYDGNAERPIVTLASTPKTASV